ncbi:MAG: hypothetical protein ABI892_09470 [Flavobacterium sp.]
MGNKSRIHSLTSLLSIGFLIIGFTSIQNYSERNLIKTSTWYIAGPVLESQETINRVRLENEIIKVTAKDNPVGEIEF